MRSPTMSISASSMRRSDTGTLAMSSPIVSAPSEPAFVLSALGPVPSVVTHEATGRAVVSGSEVSFVLVRMTLNLFHTP